MGNTTNKLTERTTNRLIVMSFGFMATFTVCMVVGLVLYLEHAKANKPDVEPEARILAAGGRTQRMDALPWFLLEASGVDNLGHVWLVSYYRAVSERMLADVGELSHLEDLTLMGGPIAKEGVPHLARLHHLRHLTLIETDLTDADLVYLYGLTELRHAYLVNNPGLTLDGIKELQRHLPDLYIAYYAGDTKNGVKADYLSGPP